MVHSISKRAAQLFSGASIAMFGLAIVTQLEVLPIQGQLFFTPATTGVDLAVSVKAMNSIVVKGDTVTYKVEIVNQGSIASDVYNLNFQMPDGFTEWFRQCTLNERAYTCAGKKLKPGEKQVFSFYLRTNAAACGPIINGIAKVSTVTDVNTANNTYTISNPVSCADLSVVVGNSITQKDGTIDIPVTVKNSGTASANFSSTLNGLVPTGLTFMYGTLCGSDNIKIICKVSALAAGKTTTYILKFKQKDACSWSTTFEMNITNPNDANVANNMSNKVTITCKITEYFCNGKPQSTPCSSSSSSNFSSSNSSKMSLTDVWISKNGPANAQCGESITYSFVVGNKSATVAQNIVFSDVVPSGLTFVSASIPQCVLQGTTVICKFPALSNANSIPFNLVFKANSSGTGDSKNIATVTVQNGDSDTTNNTSQIINTAVTCPANGSLTVEIDGPISQIYTSGQDDAVLANINFVPNAGDVMIKQIFIAVEGQNNGQSLSPHAFGNLASDIQLRNKVTGLIISGTPVHGSSTTSSAYETYKFENFMVKASEKWEFRVDFKGMVNSVVVMPIDNDQFRIHVCTQTMNNPVRCVLNGFSSQNIPYGLHAQNMTGQQITDVRPGGTITGNFHRILNPTLNVAVKSMGTSDTAVKNSKNINLFRFEARANEAADILVTSTSFIAQQGSLLNAQNYILWVDTNDDSIVDTILEKGVAAMNGKIAFSNIAGGGYVVPKEKIVLFEVHADISANLQNGSLQLSFDTTAANYIDAENVNDGADILGIATNGACASTCQIIVSTVPSKLWNLVNQGDLFITKSTTPVRNRQLLGGTLGETVLRLNFRAQNEGIDVTSLKFLQDGDTLSIDRLELYLNGNTTPFATATVAACGSSANNAVNILCANMQSSQLIVPKGQEVEVLVRPRIRNDVDGGVSGSEVTIHLLPMDEGIQVIEARGTASSSNLAQNDSDAVAEGEIFLGTNTPSANVQILGKQSFVTMSKISSIINANPDADNSNVPSGVRPIGQFKFTATTNTNSKNGLNKFSLTDIIFNVEASNIAFDKTKFKFYNKADSSTKTPCVVIDDSGTSPYYIACWNVTASLVNAQIDSGASSTFVLEANITNPQVTATTSSLQVKLERFSDIASNGVSRALSHIKWQDKDTAATTFYWIEYSDKVINSTLYKS